MGSGLFLSNGLASRAELNPPHQHRHRTLWDGSPWVDGDGAKGTAAALVFVDDVEVASATLTMLPLRCRLSSTRTERLGVAMGYALVEGAGTDADMALWLDNRGGVNTGTSGQDDTAKRYMRRDDPDIAAAIGSLVRKRAAEGLAAMKVNWIKI